MKPAFMSTITIWLVYFVCRLLMMTWRVKVVGMEHRSRAVKENPRGSFIIATFHENAIAGVLTHPGQEIYCLASRSKDGEIVAFICEHIGLGAVRGSSSRGGKEARDTLVDLLRRGKSGAITVDGPRGPRGIAKPGIVDVARNSGAPILPIAAVADRDWCLRKTWDQTRIPKPFARILVAYGEPIFVRREATGDEFEQQRIFVQEKLGQDDLTTRRKFEAMWSSAL